MCMQPSYGMMFDHAHAFAYNVYLEAVMEEQRDRFCSIHLTELLALHEAVPVSAVLTDTFCTGKTTS
jgi:hypothetical protein